jgi:hypothetical protein
MDVAVVTLGGGVPEEDVVVKQEYVCCNRDVGDLRKTWIENKLAR